MKNFFLYLIIFSFVIYLNSCTSSLETNNDTSLICKAKYISDNITKDSVLFTEANIEYFNTTTNELKLKKSFSFNDIQHFNNFSFYLGNDSLFCAHLAVDIMSSVLNELVLHQNLFDNKLYLEDGYPLWIDNLGTNSIRAQNKALRAQNWSKFIDRLRNVKKIRT